MVTVDGTLEGQPFQATLEPDGEGSHWLKVDKGLREAAGPEVGDTVALEISPVEKEPEPKLPADLRQALTANPAAKAPWPDIPPVALRHWIARLISRTTAATRAPRTDTPSATHLTGLHTPSRFAPSGHHSPGTQ